jgi:hypothetical protein
MPATQRTRAYDHYNQMHMAVDPDGVEVYCTFAEQPASTNAGHCQFCGKTDHKPI